MSLIRLKQFPHVMHLELKIYVEVNRARCEGRRRKGCRSFGLVMSTLGTLGLMHVIVLFFKCAPDGDIHRKRGEAGGSTFLRQLLPYVRIDRLVRGQSTGQYEICHTW